MPDTVFIGLPAFNRPASLRIALESLRAQTWRDLRIFVSDDASPNREIVSVLEQQAALDPRVSYRLIGENIGPKANFHAALNACDAPFFMWASDDDIWEPTFIERLMAALESRPDAKMAFGSIDNINNGGIRIRRYPGFSRFSGFATPKEAAEHFLSDPEIMGKPNLIYGLFRAEALLTYANDVWDRISFDAWGGDMVLMYGFLARHQIVTIDDVLLHKRMPTDQREEIVIPEPEAHFIPRDVFASFVERIASVAPNVESARRARAILRGRARAHRWRKVRRTLRRIGVNA